MTKPIASDEQIKHWAKQIKEIDKSKSGTSESLSDDIFGLEPVAWMKNVVTTTGVHVGNLLSEQKINYSPISKQELEFDVPLYTSDQVKQAIKAQDEIWCKAIIATQYDDGKRLVCDSEKLLHYLNTHKAIRNQET